MKVLDSYVYKKLLVYLFIVFPSFSLLSILVEFIDILRKAKNIEISSILIYILAKLPENAYYIIPISLLIAIFILVNDLVKSREIYPIILNGLSIFYINKKIVLFSLVVIVVQIINLEFVIPKTNKIYQSVYQKLKNHKEEDFKGIAYNMWLKLDKNRFLYFDFLNLDKKEGNNIIYVVFDDEFNPVERMEASKFKILSNEIEVYQTKFVVFNVLDSIKLNQFDRKVVPIFIDTENIKRLIKERKPVSISQLYKVAKVSQKYGYESSYFWSRFYQKVATVVAPFVLTVFIIGFIWSMNKIYIGISFILTIIYWYGTSFISSVAEVGNIPYYFIFTFDVLFTLIGIYKMLKTEINLS